MTAATRELAQALVPESTFHDDVARTFTVEFSRLFRFLGRLSGDHDLAADLAQEAFVRLFTRGSMPDEPGVWLISVALNLYRNVRTTASRRRRLMTVSRAESVMADAPPPPGAGLDDESRARIRRTLDRLSERDRQLLLLRAESYQYREIAVALDLNEASVGTLLARAKRAFMEASDR